MGSHQSASEVVPVTDFERLSDTVTTQANAGRLPVLHTR
jgi:hypothetical protein